MFALTIVQIHGQEPESEIKYKLSHQPKIKQIKFKYLKVTGLKRPENRGI